MYYRIANRDSSAFVTRREIFKANNIFSENKGHRFYVVYSYGHHFPLWVYDHSTFTWYGNEDKYSRTTSKHKGQSRPSIGLAQDFVWLNTEALKDLLSKAAV